MNITTMQRMFARLIFVLVSGLGIGQPAQAQYVEYIHTDALGSPVAVTDSNRVVLEHTDYEPYGKVLNHPVHDDPGYAGNVSDSAIGLSYMQQRYYDPSVGRFLSSDPLGPLSLNAWNFNRYKYAANNPYGFKDPDGRCERHLGSLLCVAPMLARTMLPVEGHVQMAAKQEAWPVPGHTEINKADKPGEGDGHFGAARNTARGPSTHTGVDIEAPVGATVVSARDGAIVRITPNPSSTYGNQVVVDNGDGTFNQYAHLNSISVSPGHMVNAGQEIGTVGRSGNTPRLGDSHLHLEERIGTPSPRISGGTVVNPLPDLPTP